MPTFSNLDDVMENALNVKLQMDDLILLGDKLYLCRNCHQVTDYWKLGEVCAQCEYDSDHQFEQERNN